MYILESSNYCNYVSIQSDETICRQGILNPFDKWIENNSRIEIENEQNKSFKLNFATKPEYKLITIL